MPELSKDVVALLSFLLPGFLVAWIFYALTSHQKPAQFERVVQALLFTLLVSVLVTVERITLLSIGRWYQLREWDRDAELIASVLTATILGLLAAYLTNTDRLHVWLRQVGISQRSSQPSEWCTVFVDHETYVVLELKDGRRLYGWPQVWPSNFERGHIFITQPSWVHSEPQVELSTTDGILVPVAEVVNVEFVKRPESTT